MIRRRDSLRQSDGEFSSINITPFTDVLLVLLIIFLIAGSSLAPTGLAVSGLTQESSTPSVDQTEPVFVEFRGSGRTRVRWAGEELALSDLERVPRGQPLILSAPADQAVGPVVRFYGKLLESGHTDVAFGSALEL